MIHYICLNFYLGMIMRNKIAETILISFCGASLGILGSYLVKHSGLPTQMFIGGVSAVVGELVGLLIYRYYSQKINKSKTKKLTVNIVTLKSIIYLVLILVYIYCMFGYQNVFARVMKNGGLAETVGMFFLSIFVCIISPGELLHSLIQRKKTVILSIYLSISLSIALYRHFLVEKSSNLIGGIFIYCSIISVFFLWAIEDDYD
jgi:hypothetical protein